MKTLAGDLRRRLMMSTIIVFSLGLMLSVAFSVYEMREATETMTDATLQAQARELLAGLHASGPQRVLAPLPDREAAYRATDMSALGYTLYDRAGRVVAMSSGLRQPLPLLPAAHGEPFSPLHDLGADGRTALGATAPGGGTLVVARGPLDPEQLAGLLVFEAWEHLSALVLFAVVSFVLILLVVRWSFRPLERAAQEAAAIGPGSMSRRLPLEGLPGEVKSLAAAVNGALDRLDTAYAAQLRLTADAAHELRTPLTVLGLRLQRTKLTGGEVEWPAVERDLAGMARVVGQLLDLARKEDPSRAVDPASLPPINLARVVREVAAIVMPLVEAKGRLLEVDAPEMVLVRARSDDVGDALRNLLDNAIGHGAGTIRITVRSGPHTRSGQWAIVEVADEGRGIPSELGIAAFDRFRKGDAGSLGAGLGLAIVRHVALTYGGDVDVLPGLGCRIEMMLPLCTEEPGIAALAPMAWINRIAMVSEAPTSS